MQAAPAPPEDAVPGASPAGEDRLDGSGVPSLHWQGETLRSSTDFMSGAVPEVSIPAPEVAPPPQAQAADPIDEPALPDADKRSQLVLPVANRILEPPQPALPIAFLSGMVIALAVIHTTLARRRAP